MYAEERQQAILSKARLDARADAGPDAPASAARLDARRYPGALMLGGRLRGRAQAAAGGFGGHGGAGVRVVQA